MDTSGKGGAVKALAGPVNPRGAKVVAFGAPTKEELAHDFLWRIEKELPPPGLIGIFDRSHYEDVLVVRVRDLVPQSEWETRYDRINAWEERLAGEGVVFLKVMLHISKQEQKERLLARLDRPDKHWKVNPGDLDDRLLWDDFQAAYEVMLERLLHAGVAVPRAARRPQVVPRLGAHPPPARDARGHGPAVAGAARPGHRRHAQGPVRDLITSAVRRAEAGKGTASQATPWRTSVSPTRTLARPLLASMFIAGGYDHLKDPGVRVDAVREAGLAEPEKLVQGVGAAMLGGGLALATGKLPRVASLVLAGALVPTTYVGHAFWKESDKTTMQMQRANFLKNVSMLGGLLLAAADTGGRESLPHAVGRVSRRTKRRPPRRRPRPRRSCTPSPSLHPSEGPCAAARGPSDVAAPVLLLVTLPV
jgi:uncharacterized membrane protein YphA (DoxX/SURF4 family)